MIMMYHMIRANTELGSIQIYLGMQNIKKLTRDPQRPNPN